MIHIAELLDHLQAAVARGESHAALALKVQNIRAEFALVEYRQKGGKPLDQVASEIESKEQSNE